MIDLSKEDVNVDTGTKEEPTLEIKEERKDAQQSKAIGEGIYLPLTFEFY